jgi:hypothetical protein
MLEKLNEGVGEVDRMLKELIKSLENKHSPALLNS